MGEYRLLLICWSAKYWKFYGALKSFLTQDLEISKLYPSYSFHPMSAKLYEDIGYHGGIQAITFLGNQPNFNMGLDGKILKCTTSWKRLAIERNEWKFGTCSPLKCVCRVLFVSSHLSSVLGHSVHFAEFLMFRFSKGYCCSFHPISTKLYGKHDNQGGIVAITLLVICQILKFYGILKFFLHESQWENLKCTTCTRRYDILKMVILGVI